MNQTIKCTSTDPRVIKAAQAFPSKLAAVQGDRIQIRSSAVYWSNKRGIDVFCSACGHEWSPIAKHLLNGSGCPACANQKKVESAGKRRAPRASAAEKARAVELKATGMSSDEVAQQLFEEGLSPQLRSGKAIDLWTNPDQAEKDRQRAAKRLQDPERRERKNANGRRYRKGFEHGKAGQRAHQAHYRKLKRGEWEILEDGTPVTLIDPPLSADDSRQLKQFFLLADLLSEQTGQQWDVDHIYPISLGGANEPYNFQLLPHLENISKGAKVRPEDQAVYASRLMALMEGEADFLSMEMKRLAPCKVITFPIDRVRSAI